MKASQEDRERGHAEWVGSLHEARTACRQSLMQASVDVSDPRRALWPAVPRRLMTQEHQTVAKCHAAVLDYAEHVEPFRHRCAGKWNEEITPAHRFPDGDSLPVVLSEIEQWADRRYEHEVGKTDELTGQKQDLQIQRVHIPSGYARKAYRKLNACLEQLQLAADLENPTFDTKNDDPGLIHGDQ
jgi:hypothetical protein